MHIAVAGPIATADIAPLLASPPDALPRGYAGAPLLTTLIGELLRHGHRVSAVTLSNDLEARRHATVAASGPGLSLTYVPMRRRAWRPNGLRPGRIVDLFAFERDGLAQALRRAAPDVVHAHWAYEFALAAIDSGLPHVVTCHDAPQVIARITRSAYRALRVLMARRALRAATCVTAVSPYMRDQVQAMTRTPIHVVPNPVDPAAFALALPRSARRPLRIAMVCNGWGPRKNAETALQAFAQWRSHDAGAQLHLYGHDFEPGGKAQAWAAAHGLTAALEFHGALPHAALLAALSGHDALLHPALEESFGMVLAEALAMGLPVVAGRHSGAVPWVVGDGGVLCDVRDAGAIAAALDTLLDPAHYTAYSRGGLASVRSRFTAAAVIDQYVALYCQAGQAGVAPIAGAAVRGAAR